MRALVVVLLGVLVGSSQLQAHPIHTTMTEVTITRAGRGHSVELRIRAFVDDFSAAVAVAAGRAAPGDSSFAVTEAFAYLRSAVRVYDGATAVPLEWCGARREREVVWLCLRSAFPTRGSSLALSQGMHHTLYRDQVNVVRVMEGRRSRSLLFSGSDGVKKVR